MNEKIPQSIIGLLSTIFPGCYTQAQIDSLFLYARASEPNPGGSKSAKIVSWLRQVNDTSHEPLKVLGVILDNFLERQISDDDLLAKFDEEKSKIHETLAREGLSYIRGGNVVKGGAVPTHSLDESVKRHGLVSVDIEIQRALSQIEHDPHAAAQYAGNVLEASLKAYLDHKGRVYSQGDTLAELWKAATDQMGLRPVDWDNKDLKKIASGLAVC